MNSRQKKMLARIIAAFCLTLAFSFIPTSGWIRLAVYLAIYLIIGWDILLKAFSGIIRGQVMDECFLMAVATVGAFALAIYSGSEDYLEAVAVMLFYQTGELFQSIAVHRSRRNISQLMDIRPDYANIEKDGKLVKTDPSSVPAGSTIVVLSGEKVPLDGIVLEGSSTLDTAALTGESLPRDVSQGSEVISGCINLTGRLVVRTTKDFGQSTVSKILELVENASSRKSRSENFISRFARIYTPVVCISALVLAVLPPVVLLLAGQAPVWGDWLYRALTFLVISCPCALVISVPLTFFAGLGGAGKAGILIKGSNFIEVLSKAGTVVFDKTGTLTEGSFNVTGIHHCPVEDEILLEYAALAESASTHPVSRSLRKAYGKDPDLSRVKDVHEYSGKGVVADVDGHTVACGNDRLMEMLNVPFKPCRSAGTIIHVSLDGVYYGHVIIADRIKSTSRMGVDALKAAGVDRIVMLTGDEERTASDVAQQLGIGMYYSGLLPQDKVKKVESLLETKRKGTSLCFAGDGINDAPVLTRADAGIAMGALGSDAAIEAADVVLMDDDTRKIALAVRMSRKCMAIVHENIVFAIGVKLLCLILGALGLASMWLAIFADVGVMVLAVLNAVRALFPPKMKFTS